MTDATFTRAEALLARSARRWIPGARQRPDAFRWWGPSVVGFREYHTEPETTTVFVYRFANDGSAASAEPEIRGTLMEGTRAKLIRDGELVFWIEAPITLPNRPLAPEVNATFDAVVAALTSP